jgi:acylpyruvate hydrolase
VDDVVVDVADAGGQAGIETSFETVRSVLELSSDDRARLATAAGELGGTPIADVRLAPPVPDPEKVLCIGLNYREHAAEAEKEEPDTPIVFAKFRTSLIADGESIELPPSNPSMIDWEGELAVVIGRRAHRVAEAEALDHVAGYMPFNDVSGRDLQLASPQWTMGKAFDTSGPCGPTLVLADEVADPHDLQLRTILNGEVVQEASTGEMIFSIANLIAFISSLITLEVGDVIATGTPSGVGYARDPKRFLAAGDVVEVEIEGVGRLRNPVKEGT